ncbi:sugar ABC transporter substrate-binding protein [Breznakiella homolactica]|uniref:sn-glycerol-3-phosphate-binding periplasmic protein UgpB n=2 Tax=Breznakiella homolactica TaxID=2798577 RepID=A0A7T8BB19_9SPIR|nr:sugar ABC transporter substrate-binding protein [Breznakiella homolactica]
MDRRKITVPVLLVFLCTRGFALGASDTGGDSQTVRDQPVTLRVSAWDVAANPAIELIARSFETKNPGIKIDLIDIPSADYTNKLGIMLNGRTDLDVFWIKDGDAGHSYAQRGRLLELNGYIRRDGIDLADYNGLADHFTFDGSVMALPARMDYYVLFYNKDMFDAAGLPYPSNTMTWDEFETAAGILTRGSGAEKYYGAHFHTWQACVQNWALADGIHTILDRDYAFFKPYYEMVLRMQNRDESVMDYASLLTGNIHYSSAFLAGRVGMMPMGTWLMMTVVEKIKSGESSIRWGVAALPHGPGIPPGYTVGSVTPMAISSVSAKQDAAWEFLRFAAGPEGAALYAATGGIPAHSGSSLLEEIAALEGMPEGLLEALTVRRISLDRPIQAKVMEVNQALDEIHRRIMLNEISLEEGLATMGARSRDIQDRQSISP